MSRLFFDVHGTPAPQGSKTGRPIYRGKGGAKQFTGKVAMVESSKKVAPWRQDVRAAALERIALTGWEQATGPVEVTITFYLPRPKSHYGTGRNAGQVKASAPTYPAVKPDLDKLERSTLDGLTEAGVIRDDALAVRLASRKRYGQTPGAFVEVQTL